MFDILKKWFLLVVFFRARLLYYHSSMISRATYDLQQQKNNSFVMCVLCGSGFFFCFLCTCVLPCVVGSFGLSMLQDTAN